MRATQPEITRQNSTQNAAAQSIEYTGPGLIECILSIPDILPLLLNELHSRPRDRSAAASSSSSMLSSPEPNARGCSTLI